MCFQAFSVSHKPVAHRRYATCEALNLIVEYELSIIKLEHDHHSRMTRMWEAQNVIKKSSLFLNPVNGGHLLPGLIKGGHLKLSN